jgi:hypothetical protein
VAERDQSTAPVTDALHRCQRLIETREGREQCPNDANWTGTLHVARDTYVAECCDLHRTGLIDAEPLDGDWSRLD